MTVHEHGHGSGREPGRIPAGLEEQVQAALAAHGIPEQFAAAAAAFAAMTARMAGPEALGFTLEQIEDELSGAGRELMRLLTQANLDVRAGMEEDAADSGGGSPAPVDADGVAHTRTERGHRRKATTVFGDVIVTRLARRAPARCNLYPADAALNLPDGRAHSHAVEKLCAVEAVRGSFAAAAAAVNRRCGKVVVSAQVEQLTVAAARDIGAFYAAKTPMPCSKDTLLVLQGDGKGIVMRPRALREGTRKAAAAKGRNRMATRLAAGEKNGRKRMAAIGVVFDAEPAPRRVHDVIIVDHDQRTERREGPKAVRKWLTASVDHDAADVIAATFDQAEARDPGHDRTWVVLLDGAPAQLEMFRAEAEARGVQIHILIDFVHVIEYLWKAARSFHPAGEAARDAAAEAFVAAHAAALLAGRTTDTIAELTGAADTADITDPHSGVRTAIGYLTNKADHLDYATALENGWPIATGAVEGACRHLIGDRLDITGARWCVPGAEAVLTLRALIDNEDFEEYWQFHTAAEYARNHQARYRHGLTLAA
jgi:hypothetical protein